MRQYAPNSPQAAGRILALAALADGHLNDAELALIKRSRALSELGLSAEQLDQIIQDLCTDLLASPRRNWDSACRIEPKVLQQILGEINDSALRAKLLQFCLGVAKADQALSDGEAVLLGTALEQWSRDLPARTLGAEHSRPRSERAELPDLN